MGILELKELKSNKWLSVDTIIERYRLEKWKTLVSTTTVRLARKI